MVIDREQLAWAAGVTDSDGCIYTTKRKDRGYDYITLNVVQAVDDSNNPVIPEVISRFSKIFSAPTYGPFHPSSFSWGKKQQWRVRIHGFERVQAAVAMMWPWLSGPKRSKYRTSVKRSIRELH